MGPTKENGGRWDSNEENGKVNEDTDPFTCSEKSSMARKQLTVASKSTASVQECTASHTESE
jgi:hypothetical protein